MFLRRLGISAANYFLEEIQSKNLLELVDDEEVRYVLTEHSNPSCNIKKMGSLFLILFPACIMSNWRSILFIFLLLLLSVLTFILIIVFVKWRLKILVNNLKITESSVRRIHAMLKERQIVSFSLGLPVSRSQSALRLRLFELCRSFVRILVNFSYHAVDHPKLLEERCRLMRVFYPVEMIELMESQVTEDSSHVTDRGISTLIDLATLHRSELCRLIILRFLFFTSICEATLLFYQIFILKSELEQIFNQEKAFNFLNTKYSGFPHKTTTIDHHIEGLDRVAVALNDIAMNIADKRLSAIDVQRALQQVLVMDIFCGKNRKENSNTHLVKETEIDCETECLRVDPVIMPVDQVFETIVAKDDHEVEKNSLDVDLNTVMIDRSLMGELQHVLSSRAELFAVREKKALAAFYGISEEEMDEKLRLEEDMHIGIADEKVLTRTETTGCEKTEVRSSYLENIQTVSAISDDLRAALILRRLNQEQVLGDSDVDC